ncbi:MAG: ClpXP protease specificity-enhancing factor [Burkholderiaceae bacterium]|nr:ClpXP protease specificity-enhancing factor [Burkholderiaceae bacterium]
MTEPPSTKPYLLRAIYEWCVDAGFTPYVAVAVDETVRVPPEFVKNGEIILNISALATNRLKIDNQAIEFQARFGGVPREVYVPIARVIAIYARENGHGMAFEVPRPQVPAGALPAPDAAVRPAPAPVPATQPLTGAGDTPPPAPRPGERPRLTRVK